MTTDKKLSPSMKAALIGALMTEGGTVVRLEHDVHTGTVVALIDRGLVTTSRTRMAAHLLTDEGKRVRRELLADAAGPDRAWAT